MPPSVARGSIAMGFGANIRKLRTMEHLGQAQLAEMLGVSKETVCRWEKSRYAPPVSAILKSYKRSSVAPAMNLLARKTVWP